MRTLAILAVVLLAGCQSVSPAQQAQRDNAKCFQMGFQADTPAMAQCRLSLAQQRDAADSAAAYAAIAGMYSMGQSLQSAPRPVTCHNAGYTVTCF